MELKQEISSNCDRCILYLLCINFLETGENHLECSQIQLIAQQFQQSLIQQARLIVTSHQHAIFHDLNRIAVTHLLKFISPG